MFWFKRVPENVLKAKYTEVLKSLMGLLGKYGDNANNPILIKSVSKIILTALRVNFIFIKIFF